MRSCIRKAGKRLLRRLGYEVVPCHTGELGASSLADIRRLILEAERPVILDVGANVGQSVRTFKEIGPASTIHSFEPGPATYQILVDRVGQSPGVHTYNVALGSERASRRFYENSHSDMSSFLPPSADCWGQIVRETQVDVATVDDFCERTGLAQVHLLKTDTQGFDHEVIRGAQAMLKENRIQLVLTEVIFSDMYQGLCPFDRFYRLMLDSGFKLVSLYDFCHQNNLASWSDALFLNPEFKGQPSSVRL